MFELSFWLLSVMNNDLSSFTLHYDVICFSFNGCFINTKLLCDLVLKKIANSDLPLEKIPEY